MKGGEFCRSSQLENRTLLYRMGGRPAAEAAVDILCTKLLRDGRLRRYFSTVDIDDLRRRQKNYLLHILGDKGDVGVWGGGENPFLLQIQGQDAVGIVIEQMKNTLGELRVDKILIGEIIENVWGEVAV